MESSKDEQQDSIYQNRKLLIAFYHRDNQSSNDFFIMIRNCFRNNGRRRSLFMSYNNALIISQAFKFDRTQYQNEKPYKL